MLAMPGSASSCKWYAASLWVSSRALRWSAGANGWFLPKKVKQIPVETKKKFGVAYNEVKMKSDGLGLMCYKKHVV